MEPEEVWKGYEKSLSSHNKKELQQQHFTSLSEPLLGSDGKVASLTDPVESLPVHVDWRNMGVTTRQIAGWLWQLLGLCQHGRVGIAPVTKNSRVPAKTLFQAARKQRHMQQLLEQKQFGMSVRSDTRAIDTLGAAQM